MPPVYCCHCLNCQTWSGTAFTEQALIGEGQIEVIAGEPEIYVNVTASGAESTQRLCGTCHTRLWNTSSTRPGLAVVRAGTLVASAELSPCAHIWTKRMQPWLVIPDDVPHWPESATPTEFLAALSEKPP